MNKQSSYYLNNKKYLTLASNLDSLLYELSSFYNYTVRRKIILVVEDGVTLLTGGVLEQMKEIVNKHYPMATLETVQDLYEVKSYSEIDNLDYINNNEKAFLVFFDPRQMLSTYRKYNKSLLSHLGKEGLVDDFISKVFRRDVLLSPTNELADAIEFAKKDQGSYKKSNLMPKSKFWSYDLLFYLEDQPGTNKSLTFLKEKFSIHGTKNLSELATSILYTVSVSSPLFNIIEYLSINHNFDKDKFVSQVWHQDNPMISLYSIRDLWEVMDTTEGFVKKLKDNENWDYYETYRDFQLILPMTVALAEGRFNFSKSSDIRKYWSEIAFLNKRASRIPYLVNSTLPLT